MIGQASTMAPSERINTHLGRRLELLQEWTPPEARSVLDLGCAFGAVTVGLSADGRQLYGIDVNHEYVLDAHLSYSDIVFLVGKGETLPFPDGFFDCVVMSEVLEHVEDESQTLAEVCRVLAPGGTFLLTVPHNGPLSFLDPENILYCLPSIHRVLYRLKWGTIDGMSPKVEEHRHYTLEAILELLGAAFTVDQVYRSGFLVYALVTLSKLFLKRGRLVSFLDTLLSWDYAHRYGSFACNLALRARKVQDSTYGLTRML